MNDVDTLYHILCFIFQEFATSTNKRYEGVRSYNCVYDNCDKRELLPVVCEKCHLNFCLRYVLFMNKK